jgi:hypothetical protein
MTASSSAITNLLNDTEDLLAKVPRVELYLFGSSRTRAFPADIDLLIIYQDGDASLGHDLANSIRDQPAPDVYDVLAMSQSEERELGFIGSERAVRIWPPAR